MVINFNFNDLDKYKNTLDDGFILEGEISIFEYIKMKFDEEEYSFKLIDTTSFDEELFASSECWEEFKVAVANLFLNN